MCFLGAAVDSVAVPRISPRTRTPSTPAVPVLPTEPTTVGPTNDDANSTVAVLQITDYHYLDWPKIGYQIFMQKMLNALQTLKFFMGLDPMLLKITRTYIITNDTSLDYNDNNNTTDSNEIYSTQEDQPLETNTESPLKMDISAKILNENNGKENIYPPKEKSEENNSQEPKHDDVKKTKTGSDGFFSSITGAVASFYHTLTGWF